MKLKEKLCNMNKKSIVGIILAVLAMITGTIWLKWYVGLAFGLIFLVAGFIKINAEETKNKWWMNVIWGVVIINVTFRATFLGMNLEYATELTAIKFMLNMLCVLILCAIPFFITTNWKKAIIATTFLLMILSTVNGFIFQFRGRELGPMDFLSLKTAMNVADQYSAKITAGIVEGWLSWLAAIFIQFSLPELPELPKMKTRIYTAITEFVLIFLLLSGTQELTVQTWPGIASKMNGYYLNFFLSVRDSMVKKPENYSLEIVEEFSNEYVQDDASEEKKQPNVIVIMNESFADFNMFNNKLQTSEPITPFMDSLTEDAIKGYALSSVYGGNTPNSEFEFLTCHSMAWLPNESVPYQQYIHNDRIFTLTWVMRKYGYKCISTHPYYENGWSRNAIYPHLGFEESTFIDDYPQENMVRDFVSDQEMFEYMLDKLKNKDPEKPLFLFGVTMQNHGGYEYYGENYEETIQLEGYSRDYPMARQYLNVSHKTDAAFEYLVNELKEYPEDTVILLYGDHLPRLEEEFLEELNGGAFDTMSETALKYKIPFIIWANYDIPEQTVDCTAISYLSTYLLEAAGLELTPYHQFIKETEQVIPALNSQGYYSKEKQDFIAFTEAEGEEAKWLEKHSILQYNNLFDVKKRNEKFFGQYIR